MRYIATPSGLVPAHEYRRPERQRSDLASPMLLRDQMDAIRNPATGLLYESKSSFRKAVKAAGCEIMGTDVYKAERHEDASLTNDVGEAVRQVKEGRKPAPVKPIDGLATEAISGWN